MSMRAEISSTLSNNSEDLGSRTSAQGLFNYADSYLGSAHELRAANSDVPFAEEPVRFLLYHAAELHLKAFLRASGMTIDELKAKGHKFSKLTAAAQEIGLGLDAQYVDTLIYGEETGDVMSVRYIITGYRKWIDTPTIALCAGHIRRAVRTHQNRVGHIVLRGEGSGIIDDRWELGM